MKNFNFPYFARDVAEFWRRWHISLSTWFRDYVYIPLGGSRGAVRMKVRNIFIIFIVSGFWHGANWTFIIWGALHAFYFLPLLLRNKNRKYLTPIAKGKNIPTAKEFVSILFTFVLTSFAWIFFRAESLSHAMNYVSTIFSASFIEYPYFFQMKEGFFTLILVAIFLVIEWFGRDAAHALAKVGMQWNRTLRLFFYYAIIFSILWLGGQKQDFIYFQF